MLAVLALAVLTTVGQAAAVDNGTLGIRPATESDFFHISLYPGAAIDATAIVSNHTQASVTLLNYPVDGQSTPQGTFALASQSDPRIGIGAWVQLNADHITVPANSELRVPFRLTVPVGTPPGDYAGGLIIQSPPVQGQTTTVNGGTAVRLDTVQRQGVRIYLNVAGTAIKSLQHGVLQWKKTGSALTFTLHLYNTGNTILHPSAILDLSNSIGGANTQLKFNTPESLLPRAKLDVVANLTKAPLIQSGIGRVTITSEAGTAYSQISIFYAPWTLIAIVLLILIALFYGGWRTVRFIRRTQRTIAQVANSTENTGIATARAVPKARVVVQNNGIDLQTIAATGLFGTITHEDGTNSQIFDANDARKASNRKMVAAAIEKTRGIPQITLSRFSTHTTASLEQGSAHLVSTWARILRRNAHVNISTLDKKAHSHIGIALIMESKYGLAIPVFKDPDLSADTDLLAWIQATRAQSRLGKIPVEMLGGATTSIFDLSLTTNFSAIPLLLPSHTTALSVGAPRAAFAESEIYLTVDLRYCDAFEANELLDQLIDAL